jgi:hypothetical protein
MADETKIMLDLLREQYEYKKGPSLITVLTRIRNFHQCRLPEAVKILFEYESNDFAPNTQTQSSHTDNMRKLRLGV